jgi:hypothetical protein
VRWLAQRHALLNRAAGLLLVAVGIFGSLTELLPQLIVGFEISPGGWALYWLAVVLIIAALVTVSLRGEISGG